MYALIKRRLYDGVGRMITRTHVGHLPPPRGKQGTGREGKGKLGKDGKGRKGREGGREVGESDGKRMEE